MNRAPKPKSIEDLLAQLSELFGPPPVLSSSESIANYQKMMRLFAECFEPQDFFEMTLMKDVTDGTLEAVRWRRHKVLLLDRNVRDGRKTDALLKALAENKVTIVSSFDVGKPTPASKPKDDCDSSLREPPSELDHNRAIAATLVHQERLTKMEMAALAKRNKALRQLEWYRDGLGRRLGAISDQFIADCGGAGSESDAGTKADDAPPVAPR
jgi:hypothetical protein